ncbi:Heme/hemopexin-binding protein [Serratia plymuthica]|uniref:GLUG motif-containing protein n=1 Tax=Serratia plymuthica TaxID=82996 RepID=UPI0003477CC5|nr:GLUG motif-containing protein [Serratia plymuthica]QJW53208.1 Heme/hemopexin-binding protein [Serratia plymuthica]
MNKIYALVWNPAQECWNVVSENSSRRGKRSSKRRLAVALSLLGLVALEPAYALPTGQNIVAGKGDISTSGQQMTINQQSDKLITQWDGFSVGANEGVTFNQPGSNSVALNRVVGVNGSDIQGKIDANGKVFLVNPNGVVFGKNAQVNVGGLVASTRDISNADFLAGKNRFVGKSQAEVRNDGTLTAAQAGSVALLGARVSNQGVIQAQMGSIALGAGDDITLNFDGNKLLNLQVDGAAVNALVQNGGLLKAEGGQVLMTAKAASDVLQTVVNNQGTITATTLSNQAGRIVLDGGNGGVVNVAGTLDASAAAGNGGVVETRGAHVAVQPAAQVTTHAANGKTGSWKIAAAEVKVADNGTLNAATLANGLANNNVALTSTQGDVSVSGAVDWQSDNKLSLTSERAGVKLNAPLKATGAGAGLELNHKTGYALNNDAAVTLSGSKATFSANGEGYQVVQDLNQLRGIEKDMNGRYVLGTNITDAGHINPIGGDHTFNGVFDGLGNTVKGLSVTGKGPFVGLFNVLEGRISNLNLDSLTVNASSNSDFVGGLVGLNLGEISNVKASNIQVRGGKELGGLVGRNFGAMNHVSATGKVTGDNQTVSIGGLVGINYGENASVSNSQANVDVSGSMQDKASYGGVGGLVGKNDGGSIANASSQGNVTANGARLSVGGLVGFNTSPGKISNSRATGNVVGGQGSQVGGLIGLNNGATSNSAAGGKVNSNGAEAIGGLVGWNLHGTIDNAKASGDVTDLASANMGGLVGSNNYGSVKQSEAKNTVIGGANANVGGLIGYNIGELANVAYHGNVSAGKDSLVGGLVGLNADGNISASEASGKVTGYRSTSVGGLVGENQGATLSNVKVQSDVTGGVNVGGLVGNNINGNIDNASAQVNVSAGDNGRVGGLVGNNIKGNLNNASAQGTVSAGDNGYVGGLVGNNDSGSIKNAQAKVNVKGGNKSNSGGLAGYNSGALSLVTAEGNVSGGAESYVGGLVGNHAISSTGSISQAKASGKVTGGNSSSVGGLVGLNAALIANSTASGQLSGGNNAIIGGLAGKNVGKISYSVFDGNINRLAPSAGQLVGGLAGINFNYLTGNKVSGEAEKLPLVAFSPRPGLIK